jgi:hypothetical protein
MVSPDFVEHQAKAREITREKGGREKRAGK